MEISSIENSNLHIQIKNLNICTTHSKTHGKSGEVATLDEMLRISLRVSSKLPSSPSSLLSSVIAVLARTSAYPGTTAAFARTLITSIKKDEEKHLKQNKNIIWREEMNLKPSILAETQHLIVNETVRYNVELTHVDLDSCCLLLHKLLHPFIIANGYPCDMQPRRGDASIHA